MTLDISSIRPARGAGELTPAQLSGAPWRYYGQRVLLGAGLLDATAGQEYTHSINWRAVIVSHQDELDMLQSRYCVLGLTSPSHNYHLAARELGIPEASWENSPQAFKLGFLTCRTGHNSQECDPVALHYLADPEHDSSVRPDQALGQAWIMYCEATIG